MRDLSSIQSIRDKFQFAVRAHANCSLQATFVKVDTKIMKLAYWRGVWGESAWNGRRVKASFTLHIFTRISCVMNMKSYGGESMRAVTLQFA
jgi:hypothetical protein